MAKIEDGCFWFKNKTCWQLEIHNSINKDLCTPCLLARTLEDGSLNIRDDKKMKERD